MLINEGRTVALGRIGQRIADLVFEARLTRRRDAAAPGPAAPRRSPAHRPPGIPWPRGHRRPGPPAGSRRAPAPAPRRPSAAAAAAHPDAGRSPRTSPPEPALCPHRCPYHISMPHSRRLRVIFLQALRKPVLPFSGGSLPAGIVRSGRGGPGRAARVLAGGGKAGRRCPGRPSQPVMPVMPEPRIGA